MVVISRPLLLEIISFLGVSGNGQWAASYGELPICTLQLRFATTPPQDLHYVPVHYLDRECGKYGAVRDSAGVVRKVRDSAGVVRKVREWCGRCGGSAESAGVVRKVRG